MQDTWIGIYVVSTSHSTCMQFFQSCFMFSWLWRFALSLSSVEFGLCFNLLHFLNFLSCRRRFVFVSFFLMVPTMFFFLSYIFQSGFGVFHAIFRFYNGFVAESSDVFHHCRGNVSNLKYCAPANSWSLFAIVAFSSS